MDGRDEFIVGSAVLAREPGRLLEFGLRFRLPMGDAEGHGEIVVESRVAGVVMRKAR